MTMDREAHEVETLFRGTEQEIWADATGADPDTLPNNPFGSTDRELESVEGWDGDFLDDVEIAERNISGDHNGQTVTDRPVELAEELSYRDVVEQREAELAQARERIAQLETLADPGFQQRQAAAREEFEYQMLANPGQTLAHIAALEQRVQKQEDNRFNASMTASHREHGRGFEAAYRDLTSMDPQSPLARAIMQEIRNSPDPGRALMQWHGSQSNGRSPPFMAGSRGRGVAPPPLPGGRRSSGEPDLADMDGGFGDEFIERDIADYASR
jgi:hypothetical protein